MKNYTIILFLFYIGIITAQTEGSGKYTIHKIEINTKGSDYGTAYLGDGQLVYARPKKGVSIVNDVWLFYDHGLGSLLYI